VGLYKALIEPVMPERQIEINSVIVDDSTLQLYHERFRHQDKRHIKNILEKRVSNKSKGR
jgi:ssRNA-specific RNase YbeY (16S rRNA maturation enzyme)